MAEPQDAHKLHKLHEQQRKAEVDKPKALRKKPKPEPQKPEGPKVHTKEEPEDEPVSKAELGCRGYMSTLCRCGLPMLFCVFILMGITAIGAAVNTAIQKGR